MIELELTKENILYLFENLRKEDKEELKYFGAFSKEEFLKICLNKNNEVYLIATNNITPIAIGGVYCENFNLKIGQVWFLCGEGYYKNRFELFKYVENKLKYFQKKFNVLYNYIFKTNFKMIRFLKNNDFKIFDLDNENFKLFCFLREEKRDDL